MTTDRRIVIASLANLRDLGTLPVRGGTFRTGEVYRSVNLAGLTDADVPQFESLRVRTIYDMRTTVEIAQAPDRPLPDTRHVHLDILADHPHAAAASIGTMFSDPASVTQALAGRTAAEVMRRSYVGLVTLPSATTGYAAFLQGLGDPDRDGAVNFHCTTGKDRAGWGAAILLSVLGADPDTIYADYLQTNSDITSFTQPILDQAAARGIDPALIEPILRVRREYLDTAFEQVTAHYGTMDDYLRHGLGVTPELVGRLRERFVVVG